MIRAYLACALPRILLQVDGGSQAARTSSGISILSGSKDLSALLAAKPALGNQSGAITSFSAVCHAGGVAARVAGDLASSSACARRGLCAAEVGPDLRIRRAKDRGRQRNNVARCTRRVSRRACHRQRRELEDEL
jgi:hypothetical protein